MRQDLLSLMGEPEDRETSFQDLDHPISFLEVPE